MTRAALMLLTVAPLAMASAQQRGEQQHAELVRARIVVDDTIARTRCTVIPHPELYVDRPISHSCRVVELDTLSRAAGTEWRFVVQRHTSVYNFGDSAGLATPDTIIETETILFSVSEGSRRLTAVMHGREEEAVIRSIYPEIGNQKDAALLSVEFCLNGTGGCWQEFWRYDRRLWSRVRDPLEALRPRVLQAFGGDSSHQLRSPRIDVRTLHGRAQIAARGDANCCPSDRAEFQLVLEGNRFRIVRFRVLANER